MVDISAITFYNFENMMKKIKTINNIRQKKLISINEFDSAGIAFV